MADVTLSFDLNGGEYSFPQIKKASGTDITIPDSIPTRVGFDFHSWYHSGTFTNYAPGDTIQVSADTTLKALWVRRSLTAKVYHNLLDQSPAIYNVSFGESFTLLPEITPDVNKDAVRFVGWDTDEYKIGLKKSQNINCLWETTNLFRRQSNRWQGIFPITANYVTYVYDGLVHTEMIRYGYNCLRPSICDSEGKLNHTHKDGLTFVGWSLSKYITEPLADPYVMEYTPLVLYAIWEHPSVTTLGKSYQVIGSDAGGDLSANMMFITDASKYSGVHFKAKGYCTNSETGSNYCYIGRVTASDYNNNAIFSTEIKQIEKIRGYIKTDSGSMVEDNTCRGYQGKEVEIEFPLALSDSGNFAILGGPGVTSNKITCDYTFVGRRITG